MSAAARAEARRKAILSRGGDRLAKLTTSARGEDGSTYLNTDAPASKSSTFIGEDSNMPTPPARPSPSPSPQPSRHVSDTFAAPNVDPSVWSPEQQAQFMQALMGGMPGMRPPPGIPQIEPRDNEGIPPTPPDDPFAAMMASLQQQQHPANDQAGGKLPAAIQSPSRLQKFMPFIHLGAMWILLGYFVLYKEPEMFKERTLSSVDVTLWSRWAELTRSPTIAGAWGIALVPFFWVFTTIQIVLHSMRIISGFDAVRPPALLGLALPHLPQIVSSIIINGMKYMQMGSLFLDDIAGLIVGIGLIIFFSTLFTQ